MTSVELIYENGVLRPLRPLDLAEGTRLEVSVVKIAAPDREQSQSQGEVDEAEYLAFLSALHEIADLPLESTPQLHAAQEHDAILYPTSGKMP